MTVTTSTETEAAAGGVVMNMKVPTLKQLPPGTKIWVRRVDAPWWPARILDINSSEYPKVLIRSKSLIRQQGPRVPVFLYGSETW